MFDVLEADDPYVHSGEAAVIVKVKFRLVVFRPFVGEVLEGKVRGSSEEGIHVSLGFFDDILIPPTCMQPDTVLYRLFGVGYFNVVTVILPNRYGRGITRGTRCSSTLASPFASGYSRNTLLRRLLCKRTR